MNPDKPVPDLLNATFHNVDKELANIASQKGSSSGCTAAVAFLRLEDDTGRPLKASEEASNGAANNRGQHGVGRDRGSDRTSGDGLWGRLSKRFDSSESKGKDASASAAKRVLYTANVGDARAVLW